MHISLKDSLARLNVPDLKDLLSYLPDVDKLGRKDELIERLVATLLGSGLKAIWSGLDETQQAAVAEAVDDPLGEYSEQRFRAKYQCVPSFRVAGAKSYGYSGSKCSALRLFIHYDHEDRSYFVPAELRARLQAFVPPPAPLELESKETLADDAGRVLRLTEREALQEVVVMLRTIEQARIQVSEKTALPGTAALRVLSEKLAGGDYYSWFEKKNKWDQEIGPIKAFAWPLLLQAGGLALRAGGRLALSPAGVKALSAPPADVVRGLWRKWMKTTLFDEFSRVEAIKGQNAKGRVMTAVAPRRAAIEEALHECPVGRWIAFDDFSRFMRATGLDFAVTQNAWKLYLGERQYGSLGYEGSGGWNILQDRYILALLFEYAATLGIVDVAYIAPERARADYHDLWGSDDLAFLSRYDGLSNFRLTPLGAYVLGLASDYRPVAIASTVVLSVLPSLLVNVVRGELAAEETLLLENWAVPVQAGSWRLDREKALSAIEKGYAIAELQGFLESRDDMPLPPTVETFIRQCERNGKALRMVGSAVLIECRDSETAEAIAAHKETGALCLRAGAKALVVRLDNVDKFRERVRLLGFGLVS
ncbi:MAG: hypothetical protein IPJ48_03465 [Propionivibrio sp.]|uniref:Helicase XPB/Ssl2 N-terminal domain-containing protein n=1 Tax=Candidatus Propionivibrio dominans TaxID=2954373 RepID=A0A9D7FHV7_9RHOO|nr:hypothetical protein [Candidatus Propionivibrio dominans]